MNETGRVWREHGVRSRFFKNHFDEWFKQNNTRFLKLAFYVYFDLYIINLYIRALQLYK